MKTERITDLWKDYEEGRAYQSAIGIAGAIPENIRFVEGRQWAPTTEATAHLPRPVINITKMVVRSKKAAILATPVKLVFCTDNDENSGREFTDFASFISKEMEQVEWDSKAINDGIIKGSYFYHYYWDENAKGTLSRLKGGLRCELIDPRNIFFANPREKSEQKQKWILIATREEINRVETMADENADKSLILPDGENSGNESGSGLCTLLTRYFRKNGEVWCERGTKNTIINAPFPLTPDIQEAKNRLGLARGEENENKDKIKEISSSPPSKERLKMTLYPIVAGAYEERNESIYGISEVEGIIPNQKAINLTMAMQILAVQSMAWGKYIVRKDALKNQFISDEPGQVLVDYSASGEGIKRMPAPAFSGMPLQVINTLSDLTRSVTGATDVMVGENYANLSGTAIARLQSQANQPIEELRNRFWRAKERQGRVLEEFFKLYYKDVPYKREKEKERGVFVGEKYQDITFALTVEPVSGTRASSAGDINMLDNLLNRGDIDVLTYLKNYPEDALCNKQELLADIKEIRENQTVLLTSEVERLKGELENHKARERENEKIMENIISVIKENRQLKEELADVYEDASVFASAIGSAVSKN